jgi:hypothetical protein
MAPKAKEKSKAEQQAEKDKRERKAADATFGLKNKNKSKVVQKFVQSVQANAKQIPGARGQMQAEANEKKKKAEEQKAALMKSLFAGLPSVQKAEAKAAKEKEERKKEEEAARAAKVEEVSEEMKKLRRCLEKLVREYPNGIIMSAIKNMVRGLEVIGFELDPSDFGYDKITDLFRSPQLDQTIALEIKDNGTIMIRPPGWKKDKDGDEDDMPIEELVEQMRKSLDPSQSTAITKESFYQWMEMKRMQKAQEKVEEKKKAKKGETPLGPTGRELFSLDANLFKDDEDATSDIDYDAREQADEADAADVVDEGVFGDEELPDDIDDDE